MTKPVPLHRSFDLVRLAFVSTAVGLLMSSFPLRSDTYWWDVALGHLLARFHAIPIHDPFSYVSSAHEVFVQPWIGLYWLFSLHEMTGLAGTLLLRNLAVVVSFGVLALISYYRNGRNAVASMTFCTLLGLVVSIGVAQLGVMVFTWPLVAGCLALGFAIRAGRLPPWTALAFAALAAFWVNLAPRFVVAALIPATFAVVLRRNVKVAAWFAASALLAVLATFAHPAGLEVWRHMPTVGINDVGLVLLAAATLDLRELPFVASRQPVAASPWRVGALVLALTTLTVALQPWSSWHGRALATLRGETVRTEPPFTGWMASDVPVEAVEVLRSWGSQPRVFVSYEHAGYVAFELGRVTVARPTVFLSPWSPERDHELFRQVLETPEVAPGVFQQHGVQAAILDPARHDALVEELRRSTEWESVLETSNSVLFMRRRKEGG
jgi:hypothetical protein